MKYIETVKKTVCGRLTAVGLVAMFSMQCAAGHIAVQPMGVSPFADTEVSTNVAFKTGWHGVKKLDVRIDCSGSVSNGVEIAFGRDANADGDLSAEEIRLLLGWRGERRFVEDVAADMRFYEDAAVDGSSRFLALSVNSNSEFVPTNAVFSCDAGLCFEALAADAPRFLCDSSWNLVKVIRRGTIAANEWCYVDNAGPLFCIRVR